MNWLDAAWIAVAALSVLLGLLRGFVREVFSLAGWAAAFVVAVTFGADAAALLPSSLSSPTVRHAASFIAIFVAVLLGFGFAGILLSKAFRAAGLGIADRILGGIFGLARGALILILFVLAAAFTPLPREPLWRESALAPALETAAIALKPWLPPRIAERVRYRD